MKHSLPILLFIMLLHGKQLHAQVTPVLAWEQYTPAGPDASETTTFMDWWWELCVTVTGYGGSGVAATSVNNDGILNFVGDDLGDDYVFDGPVILENMGGFSYLYASDNSAQAIDIIAMDNISAFVYHTIHLIIPAVYAQFEIVDIDVFTEGDITYHGILLSALDTFDGKWKAVFISARYNALTELTASQFIPILIGSWATFPSGIVSDPDNTGDPFYIYGYYNKNAGGTSHDLFMSCVHNDGEIYAIVYTKSYFSYSGRDDIARHIAIDESGYLFATAHSEDNVSPYNDHIAIFKINPANGKRMWIRRFGIDIAGHEFTHGLTVTNGSTGIALTGSISDGAGGRNARTWRINNAGTTLWVKTINMTGAGTTEEGMAIGACPASGDINIIGHRSPSNTYFMARYNTTTGVPAWPAEVYDGVYSGEVTNDDMQIDFSTDGDIYVNYIVQNGPEAASVVAKYDQLILREASIAGDMHIQPNPATSYIQITGAPVHSTITIVHTDGRFVQSCYATSDVTSMDISNLSAGLYICMIRSEHETTQLRFVKTN